MTESPQSTPPPRHGHGLSPWVGGVILVALGVIFLLRNLGIFDLERWWALFLLIPAVAAFNDAWQHYRGAGEMTGRAIRSIIAGVLFLLLTIAFLFGFDWGTYWPVILILVGIGALAGVFWRR